MPLGRVQLLNPLVAEISSEPLPRGFWLSMYASNWGKAVEPAGSPTTPKTSGAFRRMPMPLPVIPLPPAVSLPVMSRQIVPDVALFCATRMPYLAGSAGTSVTLLLVILRFIVPALLILMGMMPFPSGCLTVLLDTVYLTCGAAEVEPDGPVSIWTPMPALPA